MRMDLEEKSVLRGQWLVGIDFLHMLLDLELKLSLNLDLILILSPCWNLMSLS